MTPSSERIAELLHRTRSPGWSADDTLALSAAVKGITADDAHLALLSFVTGMLSASRGCLLIARDAAMIDEVMAERDNQGGTLQ